MNSRQLAALETRKKLVEAAKMIICDKGLTNTSIEEITEACGVSKGTFYTYFKKKEDIVFELSEQMFDEILFNAKEYEGTILEKIANYMVNFSQYIEKGSLKLAQEWIKNVVNPDISQAGINKLKKDISSAQRLLQLGVDEKMLRQDTPIGALADMMNDVLYGQMLCWAISGGTYSLEERTRKFCEEHLAELMGAYLMECNSKCTEDI